jgi:hypothetical protein
VRRFHHGVERARSSSRRFDVRRRVVTLEASKAPVVRTVAARESLKNAPAGTVSPVVKERGALSPLIQSSEKTARAPGSPRSSESTGTRSWWPIRSTSPSAISVHRTSAAESPFTRRVRRPSAPSLARRYARFFASTRSCRKRPTSISAMNTLSVSKYELAPPRVRYVYVELENARAIPSAIGRSRWSTRRRSDCHAERKNTVPPTSTLTKDSAKSIA